MFNNKSFWIGLLFVLVSLGANAQISGAQAPFICSDGTVASPCFTFQSAVNKGFYSPSTGTIGVSIGGVNVGTWSSTGYSGSVSGAISGNLIVSGTGPNVIGGTTNADLQLFITGSFTGSANAQGLRLNSTLIVPASGDGFGAMLNPTINKAGSGTHADFATLRLDPPTIGAGAATLTNSTTLKVTGAPSVGTNQRAFWVTSGKVTFGNPTTEYAAAILTVSPAATENLFVSSNLGGIRLLSGSDGLGVYKTFDIQGSTTYINGASLGPIILGGTISAPIYKTASGNTGSIATATPTTIFSITTAGLYIVNSWTPNTTATVYSSWAMVRNTGDTTNATINATNSSNMTLTLTGAGAVQVTQTSGGNQTVQWTYTLIGQ